MPRDAGSIPGSGNPLQLFLPRKFLGQSSLEDYSPWGCKESDMTDQACTHTRKENRRRNSRYLAKICRECSVVYGSLQPHGPTRLRSPGIFQAKILEWAAISYSRESSWPRYRTSVFCVSCTGRQILYHCATWASKAKTGPKQLGRWLYYLFTWVRKEEKWTCKYSL